MLDSFCSRTIFKRTTLLLAATFLFPTYVHAESLLSASACQVVFEDDTAPAYSLESLYRTSEKRRSAGGYGLQPTFDNAEIDMERLASNAGEEAPPLLKGFLPDGINFIDHQLRDANGRQVVKDIGSGFFVAMRSSVKVGDQDIKTNVGVSSLALVANETRPEKWLVRPEAKAAVLSIHGGGTATAGFHVPLTLMNHFANYDVDTISLDWPWHGEGPRRHFENEREIFEWLHAFIAKYVPPGMPVIIDGHSMGGLIADMIDRLTDDPNFNLGNRIAGCISRSPVADPAPGQGSRARFDAMAEISRLRTEDPEVIARFADNEITLLEDLITDGKMHPDGFFHELVLELHHSQAIPEHKGSKFKPMLVIVGTHDSLVFVGMEDTFRKNFTSLSNVTFYEMTESESVEGGRARVGHLIGDYTNKDGEIEQYAVMREWMEKTLGIKLEKANPRGDQRRDTLAAFIQMYSAQLAFREMVASQRLISEKIGQPGSLELNEEFMRLGRELERWKDYTKKRENVIRKSRGLAPEKIQKLVDDVEKPTSTDPNSEEWVRYNFRVENLRKKHTPWTPEELQQEIDAIEKPADYADLVATEARREEINQVRNLTYAPPGENYERAKVVLARMEEITRIYKSLNAEQADLQKAVQKTMTKYRTDRDKLANMSAEYIASRPELMALQAKRKELIVRIAEKDGEFGKIATDHFVGLQNAGRFSAANYSQLPDEAMKLRAIVYDSQNELKALNAKINEMVRELALRETGTPMHELVMAISLAEESLAEAAQRMAEIQSNLYTNEAERQVLMKEYVEDLVPGNFIIRQVSMQDVMNQDTADIGPQFSVIEQMMKEWRNLWNARSPMDDSLSTSRGY